VTVAATTNGDRPHIDLNAILGQRAAVRDVTLGEHTYQFRPLNLVTAEAMEKGDVVAAFRGLIVGDDAGERFLNDMPAAALPEVIKAIYGEDALGEVERPSPGSKPSKAASKPSKRTSTPKAAR